MSATPGVLCQKLEHAIREGLRDEAADIAYRLANLKSNCTVRLEQPTLPDDSIELTIIVEKNSVHIKTLNIKAMPYDTLMDLKYRIHRDYKFTPSFQRWIINDRLVKTDHCTLASLGVIPGKKCQVFLNIIEPKVEKPPIGWTCRRCTLVNPPTRPGCEACSSARPDNYKIPADYVMTAAEIERIKKEQYSERAWKQAEMARRQQVEREYRRYLDTDFNNVVVIHEPLTCPVCINDVVEGIILRDCLHVFCRPCLRETVTSSEDPAIRCPDADCKSFLLDREIKELLSEAEYAKYLDRSINAAERQTGNAFHCLTPNCTAWCIFEDRVNEFHCPVCRIVNCLTCRTIHAGKTCKEYQDDISRLAWTNEEARRTKEAIEEMLRNKIAMHCPYCQIVIIKTTGCNHMICTFCKKNFNWLGV